MKSITTKEYISGSDTSKIDLTCIHHEDSGDFTFVIDNEHEITTSFDDISLLSDISLTVESLRIEAPSNELLDFIWANVEVVERGRTFATANAKKS